MKRDIYTIIGWGAMVAVPLAPAFFFGWEIYTAVLDMTAIAWLAVPVAVVSAAGLETVGIFAGHVGMAYHERSDRRWWLAATIMMIYVAIGVYELRGTIGMVMFLIAPLVYVLMALHHGLETAVTDERKAVQADKDFSRRLALQKEQWKHEEKLARITAKPPQISQKSRSNSQSNLAADSLHYECVCGRVFTGSRSYNAHRRHCKIPANEPVRISANREQLDAIAAQNGHARQ